MYSSEQYSVHRFSICRSSVRHFPERSWTEVAFPYFTVVKSFTSWYALLLLFFLRFSSISLHCSPIQFSLAFFMHLLILLFTSLYFSDPSGSDLFFLSSLLSSHRSRISAMIQGFFSSDDVCQGSHWLFLTSNWPNFTLSYSLVMSSARSTRSSTTSQLRYLMSLTLLRSCWQISITREITLHSRQVPKTGSPISVFDRKQSMNREQLIRSQLVAAKTACQPLGECHRVSRVERFIAKWVD